MSMEEQPIVPILPLSDTVIFPHMNLTLAFTDPTLISAIEEATSREDKQVSIFTVKEEVKNRKARSNDLYGTGTLAVIKKLARYKDGMQLVLQGVSRVEIEKVIAEEPFIKAKLKTLPDPKDGSAEEEASHRLVIDLAQKMLSLVRPDVKMELGFIIQEVENPLYQIYLLASFLPLDVEQEMQLLSASNRVELLNLLHKHLKHEVQVLELRDQIDSEVQSKLSDEQKEQMLRRQMDAIRKELGDDRPELADAKELRQRLRGLKLPTHIGSEIEKEIVRLERMSSVSADYQLTRDYLELALDLPWNESTDSNLDLEKAEDILNKDHFGLKDIKERILDHLAVMKLNPDANSPILCFVGPPGVGKTSVGQSIARAMGREFERMSLGGLHDEAELRGHRRTYIGAMPGRIIQAIRRSEVNNPLIMLDEVDKLGQDFRGDPAAALMEILDPSQNFEFRDNFLDLPFDLSKVFFITTANTLENIPLPLLDRMEVLRLSGYTDIEKTQIAVKYLLPRQLLEKGLAPEQLNLSDEVIRAIIRRYTKEAGVRELNRTLGSLARKVARKVVANMDEKLTIEEKDLAELLGPEPYREDPIRKALPPGVAAGLAWTPFGGSVLYIESVLLPHTKELVLTGKLGDVMRESAMAAQSYLKTNEKKFKFTKNATRDFGVHIHVPSGAVPKDGPSAGITMVTSLASLYSGLAVQHDTAMTGEMTLSGMVLPVGGIKEKVLAAYQMGMKRIIIPSDNKNDLQELPESVRETMEFCPVENIDQVLKLMIPKLCR